MSKMTLKHRIRFQVGKRKMVQMDPIQKLITGYRKFNEQYFKGNTPLYEELVENGQAPKIMMIACCDSRVDPSIVTNSKPGELFVVRNVANLVPPCDHHPHAHQHSTSSALEFAVRFLEVEHIIVFGHSHCGGIQALMTHENTNKKHPSDFISAWMDIAEPARVKVKQEYGHLSSEEQALRCEEFAIKISLDNLMSFPWIAEKVKNNSLKLHGWHFDLASGLIRTLDYKTHQYIELKDL
jgi:carbonic anhydrase